jgi:uncharacterized radical SAM protein YgiQ
MSQADMKERGWDAPDVIIVTGDAYVDHPSYSTAVIGRVLEAAGFRVGIIAQPAWHNKDAFMSLGRPGLFFGVTAGNLDSMVANYTANKKVRNNDEYSPGGRPGLRPDRAAIVYANRIREAFPGVPVVLGGIEASMRRLAHYDYWSDKVRRSILLDSKADILIYGMGEKQVTEIASRMKNGESVKSLDDIKGTVVARSGISALRDFVKIPSFEEVSSDKKKFSEAVKIYYAEADPFNGRTVVQEHQGRFVVQLPPALPLSGRELDGIYGLDYAGDWHPVYGKDGGVPGFETVRFSIISHRGCCGGCNFCSLALHQGRIVQSRSAESVIEEARRLTMRKKFRGTITDIGGPTANLYMAECAMWREKGSCRGKACLMPSKCQALKLGYDKTVKLWEEVLKIPKVKHIFIGSGMRYDLLTESYSDGYLKALCARHISGRLKVAPEHSVDSVLKLMGKPSFKVYERFVERFNRFNRKLDKKQFLVNYFITSHPGATLNDALELCKCLEEKRIYPEQIQDYLPLPMTASAAMYHTGTDPFTGRKMHVARNAGERRSQRAFIQYKDPRHRKHVLKGLSSLKDTHDFID